MADNNDWLQQTERMKARNVVEAERARTRQLMEEIKAEGRERIEAEKRRVEVAAGKFVDRENETYAQAAARLLHRSNERERIAGRK